MTYFAKHSAFLLLVIFAAHAVAGNTTKAFSPSSPLSGADTLQSRTLCVDYENHFTPENDQPSGKKQPVGSTSCNTLSQILPANYIFLLFPDSESDVFKNSLLLPASQSFVLQEPDPPRLPSLYAG
ncbi:hypothetical protein [Fodinibius sediminis]|uniref:hypothetical protein n=1 Tax=Fodinibius sediminis TaxID=1214077 RepID=UPI00115C065E|nr:hypothetical protein [Fodinibius sediminis]